MEKKNSESVGLDERGHPYTQGPRAREGKDHGNWPVQGSKGTYRVHLRHGMSRVRSSMQHTIGIIFHDVKWGYARHSRGAT